MCPHTAPARTRATTGAAMSSAPIGGLVCRRLGVEIPRGGAMTADASSVTVLRSFTRAHLDGALALFAAEGWETYTADPERTCRALGAPGVTTVIAEDEETVVGLVQLQSD